MSLSGVKTTTVLVAYSATPGSSGILYHTKQVKLDSWTEHGSSGIIHISFSGDYI